MKVSLCQLKAPPVGSVKNNLKLKHFKAKFVTFVTSQKLL